MQRSQGALLATQPVLERVRLGRQLVTLCRPASPGAALSAGPRRRAPAGSGSARSGGGSSAGSDGGPSRPRTPLGGVAPPPGLEELALGPPADSKDPDASSECSTADTAAFGAWAAEPGPPAGAAAPAWPAAPVLRLDAALAGPAAAPLLGAPGCPTVGSAYHHLGLCKPCAHAFRTGCRNGIQCPFCHLCGAGELKRRKKERKVNCHSVQQHRQRPVMHSANPTPWDLVKLL